MRNEKEDLVYKLNEANTSIYNGQSKEDQNQELQRQLAEATKSIRALFAKNSGLSETNLKLQKTFKMTEAQYVSKYQMLQSRLNLLCTNYRSVKKKLVGVSEKLRTQAMLKANYDNMPIEDKILQIFKGDKNKFEEFIAHKYGIHWIFI